MTARMGFLEPDPIRVMIHSAVRRSMSYFWRGVHEHEPGDEHEDEVVGERCEREECRRRARESAFR